MRKYIKRMGRFVTGILTVLFFACILTFFCTPVSEAPVTYAKAGTDEIDWKWCFGYRRWRCL